MADTPVKTFSLYEWNAAEQRWAGLKQQTGWIDCCDVIADSYPRSVGRFLLLDDWSGEDLTEQAIDAIESWPSIR